MCPAMLHRSLQALYYFKTLVFSSAYPGTMKPKTAAILIVDDDQNDQMLMALAFFKLQISNPVLCVDSGNEAIRYLNGEGQYSDRKQFPYPAFILSDLKMPEGDGLALLENLKSRPEWAVIPAIIISGSGDSDDIKKAFKLGASAYFVKPNSPEEFERMMRVTYEFWTLSETPEVNEHGQQLATDSKGKIGERFPPKAVSS